MLALVMFLNGLAVMVLEMVGARLLAPWLGTSVIVWTSLIGVILTSLSLGYWMGGRLADSSLRTHSITKPKLKKCEDESAEEQALSRARIMLSALLGLAALFVFITALVQTVVLTTLSKAIPSMHTAAVVAALILFAVPSILCGMVSPYVTRLAINNHSENAGAVIGKLNAISTLGSILGTFLGGFILVSWFGSTEITLGVAVCLLFAALVASMRPAVPKIVLLVLIIVSGVAGRSYSQFQAAAGTLTIETPYNTMRISEGMLKDRPIRLLTTNPGSCQSGAFLDNPADLAFDYTRYYALGTALNPKASRILMLGGGGYSVPKWLFSADSGLASPNFQLDVVELDPGITKAAQDHFWAPTTDPRITIYHEDARGFLNRTAAANATGKFGPYNLIFEDVFNSYYTVPFHVGTQEAAEKIHSLLAEDGIFIMNIITAVEGDKGRLLRSVHRAFATVFQDVYVFAVQDPRNGSLVQNVMIMGFRTPRKLPEIYETTPHIAKMLQHQWRQPLAQDVPPLTDNYAPVERYTLGFIE